MFQLRRLPLLSTYTGNLGLSINEPTIYEVGSYFGSGTNLDSEDYHNSGKQFQPKISKFIGKSQRDPKETIGLPALAENEAIRHYVRLSQKNFSIDTGFYPLGSCSMKYNPRINEVIARYPGFAHTHPLQPPETVQGAYQVIADLEDWLLNITGMAGITLTPAAGAHGELCGIMAIRKALTASGNTEKDTILIPESAHGTNPASAALCGFSTREVKAKSDGRLDLDDLKSKITPNVAGIMLTNPSTVGLFENDIKLVADLMHENGSYFYLDGANLNAILARVKISDLGVDCMHINLHKTFSTPHGGGGPGAGPVVFSERLLQTIPVPILKRNDDGSFDVSETYGPQSENPDSLGRMKPFLGQMGMYTRALAYCMAYGGEGLRQVSGDAILNANYIFSSLKTKLSPAFPENDHTTHEVIFSDDWLSGSGVQTLDIAKALLDEGVHPPTIYFPLVVHGAFLAEPTETESKRSLDQFISTMEDIYERVQECRNGNEEMLQKFKNAPQHTPIGRLDETGAARNPKVVWTPAEP